MQSILKRGLEVTLPTWLLEAKSWRLNLPTPSPHIDCSSVPWNFQTPNWKALEAQSSSARSSGSCFNSVITVPEEHIELQTGLIERKAQKTLKTEVKLPASDFRPFWMASVTNSSAFTCDIFMCRWFLLGVIKEFARGGRACPHAQQALLVQKSH